MSTKPTLSQTVPSLLAIAAMSHFTMPTAARALTTTPRCLFVTFFFNTAVDCVFEFNGGPVDPGALLSQGTTLSAANLGQCQNIVSATPILSYSFFVNGDAAGCNVFVYDSANCPGTGTKVPVQVNKGECKESISLTGVKSYKLVCPK